jgi:glycosyltransferase involved in cell wall biosynthesis
MKPGMHIGFLCNEYPPARHGGIGSYTQTLARELVRRGHRVTSLGIYAPEDARDEVDQGVRVLRLRQGAVPGLRVAENGWRLRRALEALQAADPLDVLEGAERSFFLVRRDFPVPKVIRMHGGYTFFQTTLRHRPNRWMTFQERRSFGVADHVCAVSRYVAETTRELLGLGPLPIRVILNPVDLEKFRPASPDTEEEGRIVYVGTLIEKKGSRQLVQAMPAIVAACPTAHLHIYGNDTRDPASGRSFLDILRAHVAPEVKDRVHFEGPARREDVPAVLARASVCIYPSHMEALPIAWIEGLAMGKAVVAARIGPGPEVLEDGVSGLLCDPHRPESIAEAVVTVLRDPELRRRFGRAGRERAERLFSLDRLLEENIAYYASLAAGPRRD